MPLTFIEIERQKSWKIGALFISLVVLYFVFAFVIFQMLACYVPGVFVKTGSFLILQNLKYLAAIAFFALTIAIVHFATSGLIAVQKVIEQVGAVSPDSKDGIHRQLINIIDEIQIATGNKKKIQCLVIPTLSTNALAVTDLRGKAVIAITEGLLSRLTRPQLESVIAHEAYHVLSGDCLETSLATSLFGMYASALERFRLSEIMEAPRAAPIALAFWVLVKLATALNMFISRQREYRADAGAVRMTRNPLALAEALNLISKRWSGTGLISEGLEMLCISSPGVNAYDESEGWWDNLMSTHPPINNRINILLKMAHANASMLINKETEKKVMSPDSTEPLYYALDPDNQWLGPFSISELATFTWFSPQSWISTDRGEKAERVSENHFLNKFFEQRFPVKGSDICPLCHQPLSEISYENTTIRQCKFCRGTLVDNDKVMRIIARHETMCSNRIISLVRAVTADNQHSLAIRKLSQLKKKKEPPIPCPRCGRKMFRSFYSYAYLLEIDRCGFCRITWFDKDELEMLQCIIENKIQPF